MYTPLSQSHAWLGVTQYSAAFQTHIHGVHWVVGRREEGKQGEAGKERGRKEGGWGREQGRVGEGEQGERGRRGGREQGEGGRDYARQAESISG